MRYFSLLLIACVFATNASSKCVGSGIYEFSDSRTLNKNGLIILEFYASSQALIPDINKKYPVYLILKKHKIPLSVVSVLQGEYMETQVILKPTFYPKENETYELVIDSLPEHERNPERYNELTGKWEKLSFKILNTIDTTPPILKSKITEAKKTLIQYGCGPATWVYFSIVSEDSSKCYVFASVKNKITANRTNYILQIENNQVKVGHGMCSGPVLFDKGNTYEVTFSLFDQSGNKSKLTTPLLFTRPDKETNDE